MKTIEVEIDEAEFDELKLSSSKISFDELQKKIAIKKFVSATQKMREAAKKDGLGNLSEQEIFQMVNEEKKALY